MISISVDLFSFWILFYFTFTEYEIAVLLCRYKDELTYLVERLKGARTAWEIQNIAHGRKEKNVDVCVGKMN